MAVLTQARCTQFYVGDQEYPGFLSLTGNYDGISQSGIVSFSASVTIADTPLNPTSIDTRLTSTRQVFCYGTEVVIKVQDDRGNFRRPRCIPKLFIRTVSPFNPRTRQITLELTDGLGLCGSYTTDHWRKPETEIQNGDRTTDEETQKVSYWFEQWNKEKGETGGEGIIGTILSKLGLRYGGKVSGTVKTPWSLSGSLLSACGNLAFRSNTPSFLWCDYNGDVRVSKIEIEPSLKLEVNCNPVEFSPVSTAEPIKQLIVTAQIPVLKEVEEGAEEDLETGGRCTETEQYGPEYAYNPDAPFADTPFGSKDYLLSIERTCVWQYQDSKKTVTTRTERRGLAFPDFREDDPYIFLPGSRADMIQTYEETQWQYFDSESGRLIREETTKKEPWGKVFNNWYDKHQDWHLENAIYPNAVARPSDFPDEAKYADFLYTSEFIEKTYKYDYRGKQKKVETTVERPVLAILDDYTGTLQQGAYMNFRVFAIASQTLEQWTINQGNETHIQTERRPMQLDAADSLNKREQYLFQVAPNAGSNESLISIPYFIRLKPPDIGVEFDIALKEPNQVSDKHRLTLISRRTTAESSRSGLANAPATEYLPNGTNEPDPTDLEQQEWTTETEVYRLSWDETCPDAAYEPPREITDLGEVRSLSQLRAIAQTIFFLRQGQSLTYELTLPLEDYWINGDFEPSFRLDYYDCCDGVWSSHLVHGIAIELTPKQNLVQLELLWLGSRVDTAGIDPNTGYQTDTEGNPIYQPTGEIADSATGWPLNGQGDPYYPPLGYAIDRASGFPIYNGNLIDPTTGYVIDPDSGFPTVAIPVGAASQLVDPATGLFIDSETGYPIDDSGNLIDPATGWMLDPGFHPVNPETQVAVEWIASFPVPPTPPQPKNPSLNYTYRPVAKDRWKMHKADRLTLSFQELWTAAKI